MRSDATIVLTAVSERLTVIARNTPAVEALALGGKVVGVVEFAIISHLQSCQVLPKAASTVKGTRSNGLLKGFVMIDTIV